jgi:ribosomal protein S18 acetylase RimI-like enzyme
MTMKVTVPGAPDVAGLEFRHFRGEDDLPAMLAVWQAAHDADGAEEVRTLDDMRRAYATLSNCVPERDVLLAEVGGELAAYARVFWNEMSEGGRSYELFGFVHPDWRRRGLGGAMLAHNEALLRRIAAEHVEVAPKILRSGGIESDVGNGVLMRAAGYEDVRRGYDMVAPTLEGLEPTPMPEGLEVRPVTRDQFAVLWDAMNEAFRDEWGSTEPTEADWERFQADPRNEDTRFWRVGWDGDEVAGAILTTVPAAENETYRRRRVYVDSVSVRRPWRRRGLARALLSSSLVGAREDGFTSASLGVDATSLTGATDLYRSLGFEPERTFITWQKPLEA